MEAKKKSPGKGCLIVIVLIILSFWLLLSLPIGYIPGVSVKSATVLIQMQVI